MRQVMKIQPGVAGCLLLIATFAHAQVPQLINYQGRITVGGTNVTGSGQFQFALVNTGALQTYWSNGVSTVSVTVTKGLYSVLLGDAGMNAIPPSVFTNSEVWLRVWFDGQQLIPDQRIAAVGYAMMGANVPDGVITSNKLADNAVTSAKLAPGAVTAANIASGAISAAQLAKPPQSGSIASSTLAFSFNRAEGSVSFSPAFSSSPIVTLSMETTNLSLVGSLFLKGKTPTNFSFWATLPPAVPLSVDTAGNVGFYTSLATLSNGWPAISYFDNSNRALKYVRANNADGTSWDLPVSVDTNTIVGGYSTSLAVVNSNPAISYYDIANGDLKYVRAADLLGSYWNLPVSVDTAGDVGCYASLVVVNGNPAISYFDESNRDLKYVRANDVNGTSWGGGVSVDTTDFVGLHPSMAVINGNPAISYFDITNGDLKYVRAIDANGTSWETPISVDTNGSVGWYPSLVMVNGNPAISYFSPTQVCLKYVRANDASGTSWGTPVFVDTSYYVGLYNSLVMFNSTPAIGYYDTDNGDLKFVRATDTNGASWGTPISVDTTGTVGQSASMKIINGQPAISYYDTNGGDLKFIQARDYSPFTVNWIGLEP